MKLMDTVLDNMAHGAAGIPTGYHDLDKAIGGGLQPGLLYFLAGRPAYE